MGELNITDVKVVPVDGDRVLKAFVTIKINDSWAIRDMKLIEGPNGYFVAMPAKRIKTGSYKDLVHPTDASTRKILEKIVIEEYNRQLSAV